jgi:tetratricopeptide (TPR) repeat protein
MNRRHLLRAVSKVSALAVLSADGSFGNEEIRTPADLDSRAELSTHLWHVFSLTPSKMVVYPVLREQLDFLTAQLSLPQSAVVRRRLCVLAGELFQLAGEICFDGNYYTDAASCYATAAIACKEANAYDLWACALTRHALLDITEKRFAETMPLLEMAAKIASRGDTSLATRQWVSIVNAATCAGLGERDACARALDDAESVRQLGVDSQNGGWLRFDGSRLAEERGSCYVRLGQHGMAEEILSAALNQTASARRRCGILTDLTRIAAERRDSESILAHGNAALMLAHQTGSGCIARKLTGLRQDLELLRGDRRIAQMSAEIAALTSKSGSL